MCQGSRFPAYTGPFRKKEMAETSALRFVEMPGLSPARAENFLSALVLLLTQRQYRIPSHDKRIKVTSWWRPQRHHCWLFSILLGYSWRMLPHLRKYCQNHRPSRQPTKDNAQHYQQEFQVVGSLLHIFPYIKIILKARRQSMYFREASYEARSPHSAPGGLHILVLSLL